MNVRLKSPDNGAPFVERRINEKWKKEDVEVAITQLILSKSKLLELVPNFHEISNHCDQEEIDQILDLLKDIKRNAIEKIEDDICFALRYRLQKEEQKAIYRDPTSDKPYCFQTSPASSSDSEDNDQNIN